MLIGDNFFRDLKDSTINDFKHFRDLSSKGEEIQISDRRFYKIDLKNEKVKYMHFYDSYFPSSRFLGCDMSGLAFRNCIIQGVFTSCSLINTTFRNCVISAEFRGCDLSECSMSGCSFEASTIKNCDLTGLNLTNSNLSYLDSDERLISITGFDYPISIVGDMVRVGCQYHSYREWKNFEPESIEKMAKDAWDFYPTLLNLLEGIYKPVYK